MTFLYSFSGAENEPRDIHLLQTSPYMGRLKQKIAETADYLIVLVSRDTRWHFLYSFLRREETNQRSIHPLQTSPYMGRLNRSSCRSFIKVSSDRQRSGLSFLMKIVILPIFNLSAENRASQVTTADFQVSFFHFFLVLMYLSRLNRLSIYILSLISLITR